MTRRTSTVLIVSAVAVAAVLAVLLGLGHKPSAVRVEISLPAALSAEASQGQALFAENCSGCHGERGGGTDQGPPLVHRIYEPGHHPDISFQVAVQVGVRAHHWQFGNMPPQPQVSQAEVPAIAAYVRALQRANGIE